VAYRGCGGKRPLVPVQIVHLFWIKESSGCGKPRLIRSKRSDAWYGIMSLRQLFAVVAVPPSSSTLLQAYSV
jgi:hypothetical protein